MIRFRERVRRWGRRRVSESEPPPDPDDGWTDVLPFLVTATGTYSLGNNSAAFNSTRDQGSKILFFDTDATDNDDAEVYWWDGANIVDSTGSTSGLGGTYGTDPLNPNEAAILPFKDLRGAAGNAESDARLRTHNQDFACVAGGYPDWYLFRRGQTHTIFDGFLDGGRSATEPMVVASYGPIAETRAVIAPAGGTVTYDGDDRSGVNPFAAGLSGAPEVWEHVVMLSLDITAQVEHNGAYDATSLTSGGGPITLHLEDTRFTNAGLIYPPSLTTAFRTVIAFRWDAAEHNQGYYTEGYVCETTFDECCFYRNGYKANPKTNADPRRDIFSRNVYCGGGGQMGHTFTGTLIVDGASGGPQMRFGGLIEKCLVIEGLWFSHTNSNFATNPWLTAGPQTGQSAWVKNNVQLVLKYPSVNDPDSVGTSSVNAQPGSGYSLLGASFGAIVEDNIISLAMLVDDLGEDEASAAAGVAIIPTLEEYQDTNDYTIQDSIVRRNIAYRTSAGLQVGSDWTGSEGQIVEENVFVCETPVGDFASNIASTAQLNVRTNRFYSDNSLPAEPYIGTGNTVDPYADAETEESWPDPDRTIRRYVTEVCGLTLLAWADDPGVTETVGSEYDPAGIKTFMAVATNMRRGGPTAAPTSGKPSLTGDYAWDSRFTAKAVVDWIRAGFGLSPTV